MKETKQASGTAYAPESGARAAMHEMMAAFEAFKGANDARLDKIERKSSADALLEEKVARIDQAVASAQARLDRVVSEGRRPGIESGTGGPSDPGGRRGDVRNGGRIGPAPVRHALCGPGGRDRSGRAADRLENTGLTTTRDAAGGFPAVEQFCAVAAECRAIVRPEVAISYAAD